MSGPVISGEQRQWHKIVLDFAGPTRAEDAATFRDFRLDVTFTNQDSGTVIRVPGFFAADGDAANTGSTGGDVWRVNFNPPETGDWNYEVSFRRGTDIAASIDPGAGSSAGFMDGISGELSVGSTNKTGDSFFAKGMILQDEGSHFLQFQGDGDYFVRGGPGVPENFLATRDFDNTGDGRHDFSAHSGDYGGDGQTWSGGQGENILGAVNYLAAKDQNTIYVLLNTIGGDGRDVGPWKNPAIYDVAKNKTITSAGNGLTADDFATYDVSKLAQWEILFDHMDEKGIYKNFLLQEQENDQLLNNGTDVAGTPLDAERLIFIREMIARFGHANGLQWNLGEENTNSDAERKAMASYVKALDPYDHLVVVHTFPGDHDKVYDPLVGYDDFDGPSFQTGAGNVRQRTEEFREKSANAGDPWVLAWDEDSSNNSIIAPNTNDPDSTNERILREGLWGHLTAGGSGVNWYIKNGSGHSFDQNIDDFTGFESLWRWTAAATEFYNTYVPFWEMVESDDLTTNGGDYVSALDGEYYVVYAEYGQADDIRLDLSPHGDKTFDVFWFNPRSGQLVDAGTVEGGAVRQVGVETAGSPTPNVNAYQSVGSSSNARFKIQIEDAGKVPGSKWSYFTGPDEQGKQANYQGSGYYEWDDKGYTASGGVADGIGNGSPQGPLTFTIDVEHAGTYSLRVRTSRDSNNPNDRRNDLWVKVNENYENYVPDGTVDLVSNDGFVKLFGNATNSFGFSDNVDSSSHSAPNPDAKLVLPQGTHTITIAGRSSGYHVDFFELYKGGAPATDAPDTPKAAGAASSAIGETVSAAESAKDWVIFVKDEDLPLGIDPSGVTPPPDAKRVIDGTGSADRLDGGEASDTLRGFAGDDTLVGEGGSDRLEGGTGHDLLMGDSFEIFDVPGDGVSKSTQTVDFLLETNGGANDIELGSNLQSPDLETDKVVQIRLTVPELGDGLSSVESATLRFVSDRVHDGTTTLTARVRDSLDALGFGSIPNDEFVSVPGGDVEMSLNGSYGDNTLVTGVGDLAPVLNALILAQGPLSAGDTVTLQLTGEGSTRYFVQGTVALDISGTAENGAAASQELLVGTLSDVGGIGAGGGGIAAMDAGTDDVVASPSTPALFAAEAEFGLVDLVGDGGWL